MVEAEDVHDAAQMVEVEDEHDDEVSEDEDVVRGVYEDEVDEDACEERRDMEVPQLAPVQLVPQLEVEVKVEADAQSVGECDAHDNASDEECFVSGRARVAAEE